MLFLTSTDSKDRAWEIVLSLKWAIVEWPGVGSCLEGDGGNEFGWAIKSVNTTKGDDEYGVMLWGNLEGESSFRHL